MRIPRGKLPDIRYKRFVRIFVGKWRYYKNFNNALRAQDKELYEWFCANEPGFDPQQLFKMMKIKAERIPQ